MVTYTGICAGAKKDAGAKRADKDTALNDIATYDTYVPAGTSERAL